MRKVDVVFRHNDVTEEFVSGKHAIIIDVLRATTVLTTALVNGALSVRTVETIEQAKQIKKQEAEVVLIGEREAQMIKGFQFGNSPLDMTSENISGKHIVMSTSNGTKSVAAALNAKKIWAAALINLQEVANQLLRENIDIAIICSGTLGRFSLDDSLAAGMLINKLSNKEDFILSDSAQMAKMATGLNTNPHEALKDCFHLNYLLSIGYVNDVDFCLSMDTISVVPKWNGDRFVV